MVIRMGEKQHKISIPPIIHFLGDISIHSKTNLLQTGCGSDLQRYPTAQCHVWIRICAFFVIMWDTGMGAIQT